MTINEGQASNILNLISFAISEGVGNGYDNLILADDICKEFPQFRDRAKHHLDSVFPFMIVDGEIVPNTEKLTDLQLARRKQK